MVARVREHARVAGRGLDTAARKRRRTALVAVDLEAFASFLENLGGIKSIRRNESTEATPSDGLLAAGWNRRPLGPESSILTIRQKEFPMSGRGYGLINIRVRWCSTVHYSLHDTQALPYGNMKNFDYETIVTHNQRHVAKEFETAARVFETPCIFQNARWSMHQCFKRVSLRTEMPLNTCFAYSKGSLLIFRPSCH
ncbi:hypothetical protein AVEN_74340-1 [Araneus ventricosus]|uniref:Uncharacterized protein n=1 Tax=Araneus ventricosus TaxID=182803 RepID=A0A4Y2PJC6_ARAVE|nr:hypothetical protein AVEN_74340-1 [Araneus ventricosus]